MVHQIDMAELMGFAHLANACAVKAIEYLEMGYSPDDITGIFTKLFTDQFKAHLTQDALERMPRGGNGQPALDRESAVCQFSLEFASAFMKAVTKQFKKEGSNSA